MKVNVDLWLIFATNADSVSSDIIQFIGTGTPTVNDMNGIISAPKNDASNAFTDRTIVLSADKTTNKITVLRDRAPVDTAGRDIAITCGTPMEFVWIVRPRGDTGKWTLNTNADCSVKEDVIASATVSTVKKPASAIYLATASIASASLLHSLY